MAEPNRSPTRRMRLFLRDFRMLEAQITLADGQSLQSYFSHRRSYVNVVAAHWAGAQDDVSHAALRVEQLMWVTSADGDVPLTAASVTTRRPVELQLEGGLLVRGSLSLGEQQRLSDYLETTVTFLPLHGAQLLRSGRPPKAVNVALGDVAINQAAVQAVWEVRSASSDSEIPLSEVPSPLD